MMSFPPIFPHSIPPIPLPSHPFPSHLRCHSHPSSHTPSHHHVIPTHLPTLLPTPTQSIPPTEFSPPPDIFTRLAFDPLIISPSFLVLRSSLLHVVCRRGNSFFLADARVRIGLSSLLHVVCRRGYSSIYCAEIRVCIELSSPHRLSMW